MYQEEELFLHNEIWGSWDHHTRFSDVDKQKCLEKINSSQVEAHDFLKNTDWLILTLGSSFVYELQDGKIVANCHKVPTDKFNKRLLSVSEIKECIQEMMNDLFVFNNSFHFLNVFDEV